MGFLGDVGRVGAGLVTGGGSELFQNNPFGGAFNRSDPKNNPWSEVDPNGSLGGVSTDARNFGNIGAAGYQDQTNQLNEDRNFLRGLSRGENSISAEQLRQGLAQNIAAQQSMAAGARPANAAMAARTASMNAARMGSGLAGQQAMAGIAERNAAAQQLAQLNLGQRQQDLSAALGGQGNAIQGYGGIESARTSRFTGQMSQPTTGERLLGAWQSGAQMLASDERLKTEITDGDDDAGKFLKGLKAYRYRYTNEKFGKGEQLGVLAQDLEKTRLGKQAVVNTAEGKMVDPGKLAGALAAASAALNKRVERLEKGSK